MTRWGLYDWLGLLLGIFMPIAAALLYPTYRHRVDPGWAEWTRLLELPFVVCKVGVIQVAVRARYRDAAIWRRLPWDVVAAFVLLGAGLTISSAFMSRNPLDSILLSIITLVHLRFCAAMYFLAGEERPEAIGTLSLWLTLGLAALTMLTVWRFQLAPPAGTIPGGVIEWRSALPGFINVRHFGSWSGAIAAGLMMGAALWRGEGPTADRAVVSAGGGADLLVRYARRAPGDGRGGGDRADQPATVAIEGLDRTGRRAQRAGAGMRCPALAGRPGLSSLHKRRQSQRNRCRDGWAIVDLACHV